MSRVKPFIASSLNEIAPFHVMKILARAKELQSHGHDVIHMEVGEPDFATAQPIIEAGQQALARGMTGYSAAIGIMELREALARYYQYNYSVDICPRRIIITTGASAAIMLSLSLLINPGDGVLMSDPGYPCYRHFVHLLNGQHQLIPVSAVNHYQLTKDLVEQNWQPNTKILMLSSPANPTGTSLSSAAMKNLSGLVKAKEGILLVDEIYHGLSYGKPCNTVLSVYDEAFIVNSFSKYFGMTGWRLGWLVAPEWALEGIDRLAQNIYLAPPTPSQYAALAAFDKTSQDIMEQRRCAFQQRRDYLYEELVKLGFGIPVKPDGAFYLYANIEKFSQNSEQFCQRLLEEFHIAITPGIDFGFYEAHKHVRFAYTTDISRLQQVIERLKEFIAKITTE